MQGRLIVLFLIFFSQLSLASKEAVVISDKAIIYADIERMSPIGFLKKGKKIQIGEHAQNKGQVYPIVVSQKIVFISTDDISTEMTSDDEMSLEAERFKNVATKSDRSGNISIGYSVFQSTLLKDTKADQNENTSMPMTGVTIKGERLDINNKLGLGFLMQYFKGEDSSGDIRTQELLLGMGPLYSVLNFEKLKLRLGLYGVVSPFYQYELDPLFKVNGYALGGEGVANLQLYLTRKAALEFQAAFLAQKVLGVKFPSPYKNYNPVVMGAILSVGIAFSF